MPQSSPQTEQPVESAEGERAEGERKASMAAGNIKDRAFAIAERQKSAAAEGLGELAHATGAAASDLKERMPRAAEYLDDLSARLDGVASAVREHKVDEIVGRAADFARNRPAAFFVGSVLTGFALSRFLKSSATSRD